jgi:hypothetical protein
MAEIPREVAAKIPGIILGGLLGAGTGVATAEDDALFRGIMYALGGATMGGMLPPLQEAGNIIKEELIKGMR